MKISKKIELINELYLHGEIDKEDYIKLRKSVEPTSIKLHGIIREIREREE